MRNNKAFTIAELLIVVAITGILVAVSIPVFTGQLRKARVATNKANIRSAKAAGLAQYYDDLSAGVFVGSISHSYYKYDLASGKISVYKHYDTNTYDLTEGKKLFETASDYKVCPYIMIYAAPTTNNAEAEIQTAPYYTDASGDLPASSKNSNNNYNYYGPNPQDKTR